MPVPAPKRDKIEAKLGRSFKSFLKEKLAKGSTPNLIGREVHLDPSTVRYYIKKFKLPYSLGKRSHKPPHSPEKKSRSSQFQAAHLDFCLCPLCLEISCMEGEETHKLKRCVITCVDFRKKKKR